MQIGTRTPPSNSQPQGLPLRRRLADLVAAVWGERTLALAIALAMVLIGLVAALMQRPRFDAEARLLVRLGQEYVFQPQVGAAGAGAFPALQQVVNTEIKILQSPEIARRVITTIGAAKLFPDMAQQVSPAKGADGLREAERELASRFAVTTTPETPIIALSYRDTDPKRAAEALNAILDVYFAYRREVLVGGNEGGFTAQSVEFERRARAAAVNVQAFLTKNAIGDFDAELKSLGELQSKLDSELVEVRARRRELEGQAAALGARTRAAPADIELYTESDSAKRLVDLRLERAQLLGRYLPKSPPIRDIDGRIAELETAVAASPAGVVRRGPNPVRQEVEKDFIQVDSTARAQAAREAALATQRVRTFERLRILQDLEPQFRQIVRERTILEDNARTFRARAEDAEAYAELADKRIDTVRALERATAPTQGVSTRALIVIGAGLLGLVIGLTAALLRGLTRDRFATPGDISQRLNLPVLAVIEKAQRRGPKRGAAVHPA
jgi:polysaccharide biosynthesis protein PslE